MAKNRTATQAQARYAVVQYSYGDLTTYQGKSAFFGMDLTDEQIRNHLTNLFIDDDNFVIMSIEDQSLVDLREIDNFFKI